MTRAIFLVVLLLATPVFMSAQPTYQIVESISGKSLKIIEAALPEAVRKHLDVGKYKIVVMQSEQSYLVVFDDPNRPEGQRGSTSRMPGFEVEVRREDLQVIRSNFVR